MRFRDFYLSETDDDNDPRNTRLEFNRAIEIFFAHCKDAMPLVENNTPLQRNSRVKINGFSLIDPTKIKRRSITSPILTVINDLLAEKYPDLPRRNYSVFCTFGEPKHVYGPNRQYIIPFNNSNFALADGEDFISQRIDKNIPSPTFSALADGILENDTKLLKISSSDDHDDAAYVKVNLKKAFNDRLQENETVIEFISRHLSPEITRVGSTREIVRYKNSSVEIWTEGPVLALDSDVWDAFRRKVLEGK